MRGKFSASWFSSLSAVLLLVSSALAAQPASPGFDPLLTSTVGRFVMVETAAGRSIVEGVLGRALLPEETLERFAERLADPAMKEGAERLQAHLKSIEEEFSREFPARGVDLSPAERASLQALARRELESIDFFGQGRGLDLNRRRFQPPVEEPYYRFPAGIDAHAHPESLIQFGFESEYTMSDIEKLVSVYGPAPEFGISEQAWLEMDGKARVTWVKANLDRLFPTVRELGGLVKVVRDPVFDFLPDRLLRDSTGNLEIVLKPVNTFEEWKRRVLLINDQFGAGSMQGTMSAPTDAFFGRFAPDDRATALEDDIGFFNFHNDLDSLEKLEKGAARYAKDPSKPAANSFNHSFLGPMTRLKQDMLIQFLQANARGELLDAETLKHISGDDNSFKYVGGTAYRPDIVSGRVILEVRDAHTSMDALLERMNRGLTFLQKGRADLAPAAKLRAFDSIADFAKLPGDAQKMLRELFPAKMLPGVEYNEREKLALEAFRNFAFPMRDWDSQLAFLNRADLKNTVRLAQRGYTAKIAQIAVELRAGTITAQQASLRVQGALAQFAVESKLSEAFRLRSKELLERAAAAKFRGNRPLLAA